MKKVVVFFFATFLGTIFCNAQGVNFMGIPVSNQSFDSFGEKLCQKASLDDVGIDPILGNRYADFHAYFAGFAGCLVHIYEDDAHYLSGIWVNLPAYAGAIGIKQVKADYNNLVKSYSQKYGTPETDDLNIADMSVTFVSGNVRIEIEYIAYVNNTTHDDEAFIQISYHIQNIHTKDI